MEQDIQEKPGKPANLRQIRLMGWGLIALSLLLAYLFLILWPSGLKSDTLGDSNQTIFLFRNSNPASNISFDITLDARIILMVMIAGGLGSFIHAATSFGDYVGNEKLATNWIWWYILRPFIGMMLAVVFYLVIRGGFLSAGTEAGDINPFGIAALAGLVGMFSKQATDKLNEVFNTLFRTAGDDKRKDNLSNPIPSITDVEPQSIEPKSENLVVTVKGTGFVTGAAVRIKGVSRETEFKDETQLIAKLLPEDIEKEGEIEVTVFNPSPGGGVSPPIKLKIAPKTIPDAEPVIKGADDLSNPIPSITDVEPQSIEPKSENLVVTVKGTGFVTGAVVHIKGVSRETEFKDATQLIAKLLPGDIEKEGEIEVTVFNPSPGGGVSPPIKLKIAPQ